MTKIRNWFRGLEDKWAAAEMQKILKLVNRHFNFLFANGFVVVDSGYSWSSFGNWFIYMESDKLRLRITQDRGDISLSLGNQDSEHVLRSGYPPEKLFDLEVVLVYLTRNESYYFERPRMNLQTSLAYYSTLTLQHFDQLVELFSDSDIKNNEGELHKLGMKLFEKQNDLMRNKYHSK